MPEEPAGIVQEEQRSDRGLYVVRAVLAVLFLLLLVLGLAWFLWFRWATVPDVVGLREQQAVTRLRAAGYEAGLVTESILTQAQVEAGFEGGEVLAQSPKGGWRAVKGTKVDMRVAGGGGQAVAAETPADMSLEATTYVIVPDLTGRQEEQALERLDDIGLDGASSSVTAVVRKGEVVEQSPKPGKRVKRGSLVRMRVSAGIGGGTSGAGPVVPDVLGEPLSSARGILASWGYGATIRYGPSTTSVPKGLVYYQKPGAGESAAGGTVTIWVSRGVLKGGSPYPEPD